MIARTSPLNLMLMIAGFALWGVALNALYGTLSLGCELAWHQVSLGPLSLQRLILLSLWAALLAAHLWLLIWLWRRLRETPAQPRLEYFVVVVSVAIAGIGLIATLVTGMPVTFATPCAV